MARYDVATLAVKLVGDAQGFEKTVQGAERRMQGFANKLSQPLNAIRGMGAGIQSALVNPFQSLVTDATRFASIIPGMGVAAEAIAHPIRTAETAMLRLTQLNEDANRIGVNPQFLRALRLHAEGEAGAIQSVLSRVLKFQAQLRSGGEDLMEPGGATAGKIASELGLNVEAWKASNPEQAFLMFAKGVREAAKAGTEFEFATRIGGRGAAGMMNTFKDVKSLEMALKLVKDYGVAAQHNVNLAEQWEDVMKKLEIRIESIQDKQVMGGGTISMGMKRIEAGDWAEGVENIRHGVQNVARGLVGADQLLAPLDTQDLFKAARDSVKEFLDAATDPAKRKQLEGLAQTLKDFQLGIRDRGGNRIGIAGVKVIDDILKEAQRLAHTEKVDKSAEREAEAKRQVGYLNDMNSPWRKMSEQLGRDAESLQQSLLSPAEKAEQELLRIQSLMGTNAIDDDTYLRALKNLERGLEKPALKGAREADVDLAGSQEWARAFSRTSEGIEDKTEDQLKEEQKHTTLLSQIKDEIRLSKPKVLNAPP
jgi:hypothetical protein